MKHQKDTALLVMDMQQQLLHSLPGSKTVIRRAAEAVAAAREAGIPVIFIVVGFRKGLHELHPDNKRFGKLKEQLESKDLSRWSEIEASLQPAGTEVVCTKRRFSAFAGSDLDIVLRSNRIKHLVVCGVVTSGVVLSTVAEAADKDYMITVLADACKDRDDELHRVLVERYFPKLAEVTTVAEWTE